ncbi:MAG: arylsulfotransferase family protein [Pseudomonadota bacterium]
MANPPERDVSKIVFVVLSVLFLGLFIFLLGMYSGVTRSLPYRVVSKLWDDAKLVYRETVNHLPDGEPVHFLQPARGPGTGVTVNERDDENLVLMAGFFDGGNELRLISRDGAIVAHWPVRFSEHFPDPTHLTNPPETDRNVDIHGALINPDGSVVFNYEDSGTVKLSRCNVVLWTLPHATHHSVEKAEEGGYWIPGSRRVSSTDAEAFPPFTDAAPDVPFADRLILKVTEDGAIDLELSVTQALYDSGLEPILTAGGFPFREQSAWDRELVHLNKIGELPSAMADAFPQFEAGDLVLSLRNFNLVFVVDPDDGRVKWHHTGPWRRQHDPEFSPDGTIVIFNNNTYETELIDRSVSDPNTPRVSNIIRIDPMTGQTEIVYGMNPDQEMLSVIRGKHDLTPDGGLFITEFEAGRVFEVDAEGETVWEYINRYDDERVLEITEGRLYPGAYFEVDDWSCPSETARIRLDHQGIAA